MIKINVEDKIKTTEDYKVGDILMRVDNGWLDDSALYLVDYIILNDSIKQYTLVSIKKRNQCSAEQSFGSLEEMIKYYHRFGVIFTKVDVEMNVKLS